MTLLHSKTTWCDDMSFSDAYTIHYIEMRNHSIVGDDNILWLNFIVIRSWFFFFFDEFDKFKRAPLRINERCPVYEFANAASGWLNVRIRVFPNYRSCTVQLLSVLHLLTADSRDKKWKIRKHASKAKARVRRKETREAE